METIYFSVINTMRKYALEFREQNYPTHNGSYNVYINCFGLLSGEYLGNVPAPVKIGYKPSEDTNELIDIANELINKGYYPEIW